MPGRCTMLLPAHCRSCRANRFADNKEARASHGGSAGASRRRWLASPALRSDNNCHRNQHFHCTKNGPLAIQEQGAAAGQEQGAAQQQVGESVDRRTIPPIGRARRQGHSACGSAAASSTGASARFQGLALLQLASERQDYCCRSPPRTAAHHSSPPPPPPPPLPSTSTGGRGRATETETGGAAVTGTAAGATATADGGRLARDGGRPARHAAAAAAARRSGAAPPPRRRPGTAPPLMPRQRRGRRWRPRRGRCGRRSGAGAAVAGQGTCSAGLAAAAMRTLLGI